VLQEELTTNVRPDPNNKLRKQFQTSRTEEDWLFGSAKRKRNNVIPNRNLIQIIPESANKYELLYNLKEEDGQVNQGKKELKASTIMKYTPKKGGTKSTDNQAKYKNKVLIIGDSHVKKSATELSTNLDHSYESICFTKPGAHKDEILKRAVDEAAPLRKQDILVLWAGTNDISKNNTNEALRSLWNFMEEHMRTNIILIHAQHRHDLLNTSCVNKEVDKFNRKLEK
jgi:hypothetical protein